MKTQAAHLRNDFRRARLTFGFVLLHVNVFFFSIDIARSQEFLRPGPPGTTWDDQRADQVGYVTPEGFVDADSFLDDHNGWMGTSSVWQVLPAGLIYKTYLAGVKEPRLSARLIDVKDDSTFFEGNVGGRVGLLRHGSTDPFQPSGFQLDVEGAAQVRLDVPEEVDVRATDYRGGIVATWGNRKRQNKFGYYHLSSHVGDEFLLKNTSHNRLNFARDVIIFGHSISITDWLRIYGEAGWAFFTDVSEPWEFQFGADYAPPCATGFRGAPFVALNTHLRQEVNFGGNITFQAGWAWRGKSSGSLFRIGFHYYNGESSQYSFFDRHEQQIGFGVWFDH